MNNALLDLLAGKLTPGPLRLLVCHTSDAGLTGALHGLYRGVWNRVAGPIKPTAWPESAQGSALYDEIIMPLPRGKETLRFCLHGIASVLKPKGVVWLAGVNDLGIKSADKPLAEFFDVVEAAATGGHGRIWRASGLRAGIAQPLEKLSTKNSIALPGGVTQMASYPGLFAGGTLDEGTALLLDTLSQVQTVPQPTVLDYACGIGVIARAALGQWAGATVTAVDHDPLALLATQQNVPGCTVALSALPTDVTGTYDLVLSNPPIHQGDVQSFQVVDVLLGQLPRLLKPSGQAVLVAQVTVPIARIASIHKLQCAELSASRSFRVWRLSK